MDTKDVYVESMDGNGQWHEKSLNCDKYRKSVFHVRIMALYGNLLRK